MKESVERIRTEKSSSLIMQIADKVKGVDSAQERNDETGAVGAESGNTAKPGVIGGGAEEVAVNSAMEGKEDGAGEVAVDEAAEGTVNSEVERKEDGTEEEKEGGTVEVTIDSAAEGKEEKVETAPATEKKENEDGVITCKAALDALPTTTSSIIIRSCDDYKSENLDFTRFTELEELKIEKGCFNYPSKVKIEGLKKLKRVEIASGCFRCTNADSELVIGDCPALMEVVIGDNCFPSFKALKMSGLPSLQKFKVGKKCFREVNLDIRNMDNLEKLILGKKSFEKSLHTVIQSKGGKHA